MLARRPMDKFTRNYTIALLIIGAILLFRLFYETPGVSSLNATLAEHAELAAYPYRFRVLGFDDGVATMSTPRSAEFPAYRALVILYPQLRDHAPDSQAMIDAQQELARVQGIARRIVAESDDVTRVVWQLDEAWLRAAGFDPSRL